MPDHELTARLEEACRASAPEIVAVYLFGTVARDTAASQSDLDVAVLLSDAAADATRATEELVDRLEAVARRQVDLVVLNAAAPDLVHRVLKDGILLLDRDGSRRIRFEVQARNAYFDLEPIRRAYRTPSAAKPAARRSGAGGRRS